MAFLTTSSLSSRALIFVSHGAGEHCGRYDELAQMLKRLDMLVFAHDHGEYLQLPHGLAERPGLSPSSCLILVSGLKIYMWQLHKQGIVSDQQSLSNQSLQPGLLEAEKPKLSLFIQSLPGPRSPVEHL